MSDFERKRMAATDELERTGLRYSKSNILNRLNTPFDFLERKLRLKPLHYAGRLESWLRSGVFFAIILPVVTLVMLKDKLSWFEADRWIGWVVGAVIYACLATGLFRWQARRKKLSRWEDL